MRAVQATRSGAADVLELVDAPEPEPAPDEVQIQVRLAGVNFADVNARRGTYAAGAVPGPRGFGLEVLGEVRSVGGGVRRFRTGQRVAGFSSSPGYAEVAVAHQDLVWAVPDDVSDDQAAAFPVVGCTAYHLLRSSARLREGERVLITAAAGGVGTTAIQIARLLGAGLVVGAAGSGERAAAAVKAGADAGIGYSEGSMAEALRAVTGRSSVDVVLDGVGGSVRRAALECLDLFGRLVHFGNASGEPEEFPPARTLRERNVGLLGFHLQALRAHHREVLRDSAAALLEWLGQGALHAHVADVLPLGCAAEAQRLLESRQVRGKLLLAADR
ncbi:MAG: alcohol dehydrogenase [Streptosporangiaceae bacterium]|nr:alcohol dehydrogenase [Streptosporangiaceae bacterium]